MFLHINAVFALHAVEAGAGFALFATGPPHGDGVGLVLVLLRGRRGVELWGGVVGWSRGVYLLNPPKEGEDKRYIP